MRIEGNTACKNNFIQKNPKIYNKTFNLQNSETKPQLKPKAPLININGNFLFKSNIETIITDDFCEPKVYFSFDDKQKLEEIFSYDNIDMKAAEMNKFFAKFGYITNCSKIMNTETGKEELGITETIEAVGELLSHFKIAERNKKTENALNQKGFNVKLTATKTESIPQKYKLSFFEGNNNKNILLLELDDGSFHYMETDKSEKELFDNIDFRLDMLKELKELSCDKFLEELAKALETNHFDDIILNLK